MRKLLAVSIALLLPLGAVTAREPGTEQGCTPSGTWVGTTLEGGIPVMTITYGHESAQSGTLVIDLPGFDAALGNEQLRALGVRASSGARGLWKKTGGNTWYFTALIIGSVPGGAPVYWATIYGPVEATDHCRFITIQTWMDLKIGDNPPIIGQDLGKHGGYPMVVEVP